jgi:hypothetical protein
VIQDAVHRELGRVHRWRVIALSYAAVWGVVLRIDLAGGEAVAEAAGEVLRELAREVEQLSISTRELFSTPHDAAVSADLD